MVKIWLKGKYSGNSVGSYQPFIGVSDGKMLKYRGGKFVKLIW